MPNERLSAAGWRALAQAFAAMRRGEGLSRDVSAGQARLAGNARLRAFLQLQSRQEATHAALFAATERLLGGPVALAPAMASAFDRFEQRLLADLDRGALGASIAGLQGALEAAGLAALQAQQTGLGALAMRFMPFHATLLRQEQSHHRAGRHWLRQLAVDAPVASGIVYAARDYAALADALVGASASMLHGFDADWRCVQGAAGREIESFLADAEALLAGPNAPA